MSVTQIKEWKTSFRDEQPARSDVGVPADNAVAAGHQSRHPLRAAPVPRTRRGQFGRQEGRRR